MFGKTLIVLGILLVAAGVALVYAPCRISGRPPLLAVSHGTVLVPILVARPGQEQVHES